MPASLLNALPRMETPGGSVSGRGVASMIEHLSGSREKGDTIN